MTWHIQMQYVLRHIVWSEGNERFLTLEIQNFNVIVDQLRQLNIR